MGTFDWLSHSVDWVKNRWGEDWKDFGKTFTESWTGLPQTYQGIQNGLLGMATAKFHDDGDFWGSARMWMDSSIGAAANVAGGTLGTLFQVPILHEASWLLDKAYRYAIARPIATSWIYMSNNSRDAYMQGANPVTSFFEQMTDFNKLRRAWNDSEYVTPGQAIVYNATMAGRSLGDFESAMKWADDFDPRTPKGQAKFNSKDASFWLKYGSGSTDFITNIIADPGHGSSLAFKAAKLRLVDKVADFKYIAAGKVEGEIGTSAFSKVRDLAGKVDRETFRTLTMPDNPFGARMGNLLWTAKRMSDDVYKDTYLTMRAFDPEALQRLAQHAPAIAEDFASMYANWTLRDWDYQRGQVSFGHGADALQKTKIDAFIDSFVAGEGAWGQALAIGAGQKMPRLGMLAKLRTGYHRNILFNAPVYIARPLQNLLPSQGHTRLMDASDPTAFTLRQFKANLERSTTYENPVLSPEEINTWTSRYGQATSDATRHALAAQITDHVMTKTFKEFGIAKKDMRTVLAEVNRWRTGARKIFYYDRIYISDKAAQRAEQAAMDGRMDAANDLLATSAAVKKAAAAGEVSDGFWASRDEDGAIVLTPVSVDRSLPFLRSQFASAIMMPDFRAVRAGLRWWKLTHPTPRLLEDGSKAPVGTWRQGLAELAKARGFFDSAIGSLDSLSMIWKSSALARPAQMFRNVAPDTLATIAEFGKLPVMMLAAQGAVNIVKNFGSWNKGNPGRLRLIYEQIGEARARRQAEGTTHLPAEADLDGPEVPGNIATTDLDKPYNKAFADGDISLRDYLNRLEEIFDERVDQYSKNATPGVFGEKKAAKAKVPELFKRTATKAAVGENVSQLRQAAELVVKLKEVGTGYVARKLQVSADRAEELMGILEGQGVVGPAEGKNPRPVLITPDKAAGFLAGLDKLEGNRPERIDPNAMPGAAKAVPSPRDPGELTANDIDRATREGAMYRESLVFEEQQLERLRQERAQQAAERGVSEFEMPEGFTESAQGSYGYLPPNWSKAGEFTEHRDLGTPEKPTPAGSGGWSVGPPARRRNPVETPFMPVRPGRAYYVERVKYMQYKRGVENGGISHDEYVMAVAAEALRTTKRNLFMKSTWGIPILKDLIERHLNRRRAAGYIDDPYAPGTLVVDPFTGLQPEVAVKDLAKSFDLSDDVELATRNVKGRLGQRAGTVKSVAIKEIHKALTNFILLNADELLKPDTQLSLRVKANGNIGAGFARAKPEVVAAGTTIKVGAQQRRKNFRFQGIRDAGHTGFEVALGDGRTQRFSGWAEGPTGQEMQRRISSRDNPATGFQSLVTGDADDLMEEPTVQRNLTPADPEYGVNWERDANAQLASDPVAQRFLLGKTDTEIYDEMQRKPWGTKYMHAMAFRGVAMLEHIKMVGAAVDHYVPHPLEMGDEKAAAAQSLREAVYDKKATFKMLEDLHTDAQGNVDYAAMPQIHGASVADITGNSRAWKFLRHTIRNINKYISDMPVDKMARFPFMALAVQKHATELTKIAGLYFKDGPIPANVVDHIKQISLDKAYHDVRYRLYDAAQRNDLASATRLLMPFSGAMMDAYIKYGRLVRENPMLMVQGAYYWDAFERNEMVQDENGHVLRLEDGVERWYSVDPTTGEKTLVPADQVGKYKYVQFQLPSALAGIAGKKYYGVDAKPVLAINKDTMNVFLNNPGGGPLVAFPANEFALHNPEFGENKIVRDYLLPFGPSSSRGKTFLPSTVRTAWDAFIADDQDKAAGEAAAIMQAELIGYGLGTRNTPPTFEEVREKAASLKALRFLSTFASPASFQLQSPYQSYVDSYRQLLADPATKDQAAEEFMRRHGDEFYAVQMSVTRNNAGISATIESQKSFEKYRALIAQYPEFGGLIVGRDDAGAFAKSVYESQKETTLRPGDKRTIRELMSLSESVEDLQKKVIWQKYSKMMDLITSAMVDRGIHTLRERAGKDLKETRDAFIEANRTWTDPTTGKEALSPWYMDYNTTNRAAGERKIDAMTAIVLDADLRKRDDIRGLAAYLDMRKQMQYEMHQWGVQSLSTLGQFNGLQKKWDSKVHDLVESNPAFGALWNRWLSNDDSLDYPPVPEQSNKRNR